MTTHHTVTLGGSITSALTHVAGWGLLAILQGAADESARVRWTDEDHPRLQVSTQSPPEHWGTVIQEHAAQHTTEESWPLASVAGASHAGSSLFAVRFKPPKEPAEWGEHFRQRDAFLEKASPEWLSVDDRFLTALGEPAWWRTPEGRSADEGASRWEMKTRNRGEEFLSNRFVLLARSVASRTPEQILRGLTGEDVVDEVGKDSPESRSSTGFTTPRATDNAMAWCALWGISLFPTFRQASAISQSAAVWPRTVTHPSQALLPVFTDWTSWAHGRAVVMSQAFGQLGGASAEGAPAVGTLRELGVTAVVRHPIRKAGSASAPERMLLEGEVIPL